MVNILEHIESHYPVEEILVNGEQIWPYLRIRYGFTYMAETAASYGEANYDLQASRGSKPIRRLRFMKSTLRGIRYGFRNWFRKYDYIVLTDNSVRRQMGGKYINQFLDPIIDEIGPSRVLCIESTSPFPSYGMNQVYTRHVVSTSLLILFSLLIMLLRRMFSRRYKVVNKGVMDRIEADFGSNANATNVIEFFEAKRKVFTCLFRIMRPQAILLTCYYGKEPAIRAAKSLGIKVIEIQHGVIGKEHPAYNVHRDLDRSCFPDHLLVFGKQELATFNNSRFIDQANVHPAGSFYLDYIRASCGPEPHLSERISGGYERVVGVTLQWITERRLISFICEAAKLDSSILYILIPRAQKKEYSNMGLPPNVSVIRDKNFYELMTYCDFHSTVNSTCALEAPSLGVQNILIDIDGSARVYYEKVLSDDRVTRFANTPEEYVNTVRGFPRLHRNVVRELHKDFFAPNYQENIRDFVKTYLR